MTIPSWEHFPHPADAGVRGVGRTEAEALAQAALAMTAVVVDLATIEPRTAVTVTCEEGDPELRLVAWLNAVLYEMATQGMVFGRFEVTLHEDQLKATLWGEPLDPTRHKVGTEVKAATYAALRVEQQEDGLWIAQCIVDV